MAFSPSGFWRIFSPDYCVFSVRILAYIQSGLWLLISPDFGVYSVRIMAYIQSGLLRIFSPDYGVYSVRIMANILSGLWCIFSPDYGVFSVRIMAYIQSGLCSCLVSAVYHSTKNFFYDIMESDQHYYKTSCTYWIHTMYKNKMLTSFIGKSLNI